MLAVNPLVAAPHRYLARAAEKLGPPRRGHPRLPGAARNSTRPTSPKRISAWRHCLRDDRQAGRRPPPSAHGPRRSPALPRRPQTAPRTRHRRARRGDRDQRRNRPQGPRPMIRPKPKTIAAHASPSLAARDAPASPNTGRGWRDRRGPRRRSRCGRTTPSSRTTSSRSSASNTTRMAARGRRRLGTAAVGAPTAPTATSTSPTACSS